MSIGRFFSSDSQMNKQSSSHTAATAGSTAGPALPSKNNVVSIVEYKFRRMTEEHDRIRATLLASREQNSQ